MLHLVTGGSGSGKSEYAEQQILDFGPAERVYIATMYPGKDPENLRRIERHRQMRAEKQFRTIEAFMHLDTVEIPNGSVVLLDCMSNLVANEMFLPDGAGIHTVDVIMRGVQHVLHHVSNFVIVSNEIFSDVQQYDKTTKLYKEYLGAINQMTAQLADCVTEVVYGIPVEVKR